MLAGCGGPEAWFNASVSFQQRAFPNLQGIGEVAIDGRADNGSTVSFNSASMCIPTTPDDFVYTSAGSFSGCPHQAHLVVRLLKTEVCDIRDEIAPGPRVELARSEGTVDLVCTAPSDATPIAFQLSPPP